MNNDFRTGVTYLTLRADYLNDLKVVKATQSEPSAVQGGDVVVKVKLRVPKAAFKPLQTSADVEIPEELVQHPVEVKAVEP